MNMSEIRDFLNSIEREIVNKINMSEIRDFLNKIKGHEKIRPSVRPSESRFWALKTRFWSPGIQLLVQFGMSEIRDFLNTI